MALAKTTRAAERPEAGAAGGSEGATRLSQQREAEAQRRKARTLAKQQQAAERLATSTTQLSSGIAEAASAAEELKKAMDQIAAGAEEASGAAQESLAGMNQVSGAIRLALERADESAKRTDSLQGLIATVSRDIGAFVASVRSAAERQRLAVHLVGELEKQAASIGEIVKAVARIADQTNLLALNAAIEAARAGKHGKGFAVVADEVRTLAETSERSAQEIQELVAQIQQEVRAISERINQTAETASQEVEKAQAITAQLERMGVDIIEIKGGADEIGAVNRESAKAAVEAQKGSEDIAAAAEEQSAACEEAVKTVAQQATALAQAEAAAQDLSALSDDLKNSADVAKSAEEVASAAEELSASVQELNNASGQIMTAITQISRGARQQASAAEQSAAAIAQIEKGGVLADQRSGVALEKGEAMIRLLEENQESVAALVEGIKAALDDTRKGNEQIKALEQVSRRIDKIVDAITTVSIQTNMLAVNGAIEAARAGEFGKGFVVVSTDIRNLAHDSSENADRIKEMVREVQDQVGVVRRDLEEIVTVTSAEVDKTRGIIASLQTMGEDANVVLDGSREINGAAAQLVQTVVELKKGVDQIASAAAEADQSSTQAATASKQQSQGAEELAAAIEEIASLADELQSA
ncbi:methyl-accepting chemotaxis protein [Endothiovibrio diazotrophicus]